MSDPQDRTEAGGKGSNFRQPNTLSGHLVERTNPSRQKQGYSVEGAGRARNGKLSYKGGGADSSFEAETGEGACQTTTTIVELADWDGF